MDRQFIAARSWHGVTGVLTAPLLLVPRALVAGVADPTFLLLLTLLVLVFFPPDLIAPPLDRIMVVVLAFCTIMNAVYGGRRVRLQDPVLLVCGVLAAIATASALTNETDVQTWSLLAAKFVVPVIMFVIAAQVFSRQSAVKRFFRFTNLLLLYLVIIAIAFMVGAEVLIVPRYILDPSFQSHIERARGPFLQAVANGTAINLLALLGWYWWHKSGKRSGLLLVMLVVAVAVAVAATLTRAVWLSFTASALMVVVFSSKGRPRQVAVVALALTFVITLILVAASPWAALMLERINEAGPVEFRLAAYEAALRMFQEHPILGWGTDQSARQLSNYITGYNIPLVVVHNTYLEVLLEHGLLGLSLYLATFAFLWRVGAGLPKPLSGGRARTLDQSFVPIWHAMLVVFLINGCFVVMNYQFINALMFGVAGMVRSAEWLPAVPGIPGSNEEQPPIDAALGVPLYGQVVSANK